MSLDLAAKTWLISSLLAASCGKTLLLAARNPQLAGFADRVTIRDSGRFAEAASAWTAPARQLPAPAMRIFLRLDEGWQGWEEVILPRCRAQAAARITGHHASTGVGSRT